MTNATSGLSQRNVSPESEIDRTDSTTGRDVLSSSSPPPTKKQKRSVQIAEDLNTIELIPDRATLLEQAEQQASGAKIVELTPRGVRIAASQLRKALDRNTVQRSQHSDDPTQYMESEVSLYEHIACLKAIAADPTVLYPVVITKNVSSTTSDSLWNVLCELFNHSNPDIITSLVSLLNEWLDPSLLEDVENPTPILSMASLVVQDAIDIVISFLPSRTQTSDVNPAALNEDESDEVGDGVEGILALLNNLLELDVTAYTIEKSLTGSDQSVAGLLSSKFVLVWLVQQLEEPEKYLDRSLELLALISSREDVYSAIPDWSCISCAKSFHNGDSSANLIPPDETSEGNTSSSSSSSSSSPSVDALELLLQLVARYRKTQPEDEAQLSTLENACTVVNAILLFGSANVRAFVAAQGIELVLRCVKERVHAGCLTLKWLDSIGVFTKQLSSHSTGCNSQRQACEHMLDAGILKYLLPLFMGRFFPKPATFSVTSKKDKKEWKEMVESTTIRILYMLTMHLTPSSPNNSVQRLLAKFMDNEKLDRLVELCLLYDRKTRQAEFNFYTTDLEETLDPESIPFAILDTKLQNGGEIWHCICAVTAFCCVGSQHCHERILSQLRLQQSGITVVREALEEFAGILEEGPQRQQLEFYLERI